jgi:hypothetical protein
MLISDSYRTLNEELHERRPDYGVGGHRYSDMICGMLQHFNARSFLDYGAGKDTLRAAIGEELIKHGQRHRFTLTGYDPAVAGLAADPEAADVVACTDVLEHIEPDCLESVLAHLASKVRKAAFLTVATRPAVKVLADGRNAHLIVEPWTWWAPRIDAVLPISTVNVNGPMEVHFFSIAKERANGADGAA